MSEADVRAQEDAAIVAIARARATHRAANNRLVQIAREMRNVADTLVGCSEEVLDTFEFNTYSWFSQESVKQAIADVVRAKSEVIDAANSAQRLGVAEIV